MVQMPYYCYYILRSARALKSRGRSWSVRRSWPRRWDQLGLVQNPEASFVGGKEGLLFIGNRRISHAHHYFRDHFNGPRNDRCWGVGSFLLVLEKRVPLRYYAMAHGMISGGLAMVGLAQALRLLLEINGRG